VRTDGTLAQLSPRGERAKVDHTEGNEAMNRNLELLWFLATVAPVLALSIRTNAARHKEREYERAWNIVAKYII
jgi:hypothetical protein